MNAFRNRLRQSGVAVMLLAAGLLMVCGVALAAGLSVLAFTPSRERASERALAQARAALIAYATDRAIDPVVGPGYLPCPDQDDDGWAEATCGSLSGDSGQAQRLGHLPWKSLGLPDLRDGWGERLWYAVSSKHKGLLNCAASRACVDMSPPSALGTISVRDAAGMLLFDGAAADATLERTGAAAVVIAPGPALTRRAGTVIEQRRGCTLPCDPANFLDVATSIGEDNAVFRDRNDLAGRAANSDGFVAGPVIDAAGRMVVNDRLAVVGYADLMPRVMARVALEAALCVRQQAAATPGAAYPQPAPACGDAAAPAFGRLPDFAALPGCNLAAADIEPAWWSTWRAHVLYAPAPPSGAMDALDASGNVVASARRFAIVVTPRAGECASARLRCDALACSAVTIASGPDVARAFP